MHGLAVLLTRRGVSRFVAQLLKTRFLSCLLVFLGLVPSVPALSRP